VNGANVSIGVSIGLICVGVVGAVESDGVVWNAGVDNSSVGVGYW